eukprot:snap_masked-scaffold_7-processed-gene-2.32-mRNA-1 protein AED:1.00 eAED:1.00 QI:0/0/0/0/1/1/2/0/78
MSSYSLTGQLELAEVISALTLKIKIKYLVQKLRKVTFSFSVVENYGSEFRLFGEAPEGACLSRAQHAISLNGLNRLES